MGRTPNRDPFLDHRADFGDDWDGHAKGQIRSRRCNRWINGQRYAVLGLPGRSGLAVARALAAGGVDVVVWDDNEQARAGRGGGA